MKIKTSAYSVFEELLPLATYEVVSSFACEPSPTGGPPFILGLWVADPPGSTKVTPIYLTQKQKDTLKVL